MINKTMLKLLFLSILITFSTSAIFCQWQQTNGIKGGYFSQVAGDDENILAVTNYGSIYNYKNGEWNFRSSYTYFNDIYMLDDKWVGYSSNAINISEDDGITWENKLEPDQSNFLTMVKVIDGNIYALSSDTLFVSTDIGETWNVNEFNSMVYVENYGQIDSGFIYGLSSFYVKDSIMLAAAFTTLPLSFDAVLYSTDLGQNWQLTNFPEDLTNAFGLDITANDSFFYAATTIGFFKSPDGINWTEMNEGLQFEGISMSISKIDIYNNELLAVINNTPSGLYRYKNDQWELFYDENLPGYISTENNNLIICAGGEVKQYDGYNNWNTLTSDIVASTSKPVTSSNGNVYSLYGNSIYRTTDQGLSWDIVCDSATSSFIVDQDKIFSTTSGGILRSLNNGDDWSIINTGIPASYISKLRTIGMADNKLFAGFYGINSFPRGSWGQGGIYVSTNNGDSWSSFNNGLPTQNGVPAPVYSITADGDVIILYTASGRYSLINNSWVNIDDGFPADTYISSIIIYNDELILLTSTGVYISHDKGVTKEEFNNGFPDWAYYYTSLFIYDNTLYAFSNNSSGPVYKLSGTYWIEADFPLPENVRFLSFQAAGDILYAGTYDNGIWKYDPNATDVGGNSQNVFSYRLSQNYPNPFNPTTKISWQSPVSSRQTLKIYDLLGREIKTLVDEEKPAGTYQAEFISIKSGRGNLWTQKR